MRRIAALNVLLRERIELPAGFKLATEEFREGWNFVRSSNAKRLKKKIHTQGWNFIKIADGSLRSGLGDTSQEAIASALKLALRKVNEKFNAAEVEHIELTVYPWFFLARVRVSPYRVQQEAMLPELDQSPQEPNVAKQRRLPPQAVELFPGSGSAMPMLKKMLVQSRGSEESNQ